MTTPRRQWNDETIRAALLPLADELGRMPRRSELTERGIGGLWSALSRNGGVDAWREIVAAHLAAEPAIAEVRDTADHSSEHVRVAAFFLYENGHPGDPMDHWLAAERQLVTA